MKSFWPFKSVSEKNPASSEQAALRPEYQETGVVFSAISTGWMDAPYSVSELSEQVALLAQLTEEGFAEQDGDALRLPWGSLYQLLVANDYRDSLSILGLPQMEALRPKLESRGGLTDTGFSILLAGWFDSNRRPIQGNA